MTIQPSATRTRRSGEATPSKRELQRQIGRTRQSLSQTVEEIKQTAEQGYASAKETVSGVLDYREEFQKEPVIWSLGALSVGFALGYSVGYAHKGSRKGKPSAVSQFADRAIQELSKLGRSMVMPALNMNITDLFGFDFPELLKDVGGDGKASRKKTSRKKQRAPKRAKRAKTTRARRKSG